MSHVVQSNYSRLSGILVGRSSERIDEARVVGIVGDRKKGKKRRSTSDRVDALSTADTTRTKRDDREAVRLPLLGDDYGRNMIGKITGVGFSKRKRAAGNDRRCATEEGGEHDDWIDFRKAGTMVVGASEIGSRLDARPIKSESFSSLVDGRKQKQQREGEREKRFGICKKEKKKKKRTRLDFVERSFFLLSLPLFFPADAFDSIASFPFDRNPRFEGRVEEKE